MAQLPQLIAQMEGWFATGDNWAKRNNNPGNLRPRPGTPWSGQVGTAGGFVVFVSPEDGWAALNTQITYDAKRGLTLAEFINKYAPPSENNTTNYINWVSSGLNADPNQLLSEVINPGGSTLTPDSILSSSVDTTGNPLSEAWTYAVDSVESDKAWLLPAFAIASSFLIWLAFKR